jgi:hypothetical protein
MEQHEFPNDTTWKALSNDVAMAAETVQRAETAVKKHGYSGGRREALQAAERALEAAEENLQDHEDLISHPHWGTL